MKKLFTILAVAAFGALISVTTTSCSADLEFDKNGGGLQKLVIDNIHINPTNNPRGGWQELWLDGEFDCMYGDVEMPELTPRILTGGLFFTYFKYYDKDVMVQEGEGLVVPMDWGFYTINCEYSEGNMRITIRTSDGKPLLPDEVMSFRTVIIY